MASLRILKAANCEDPSAPGTAKEIDFVYNALGNRVTMLYDDAREDLAGRVSCRLAGIFG